MKTRTKKSSNTAKASTDEKSSTAKQIQSLDESVKSPPYVFVLPKSLDQTARIVTVGSGTTRLLICPTKGCFEFTNVAAERTCRSWLLAPQDVPAGDAGLTHAQGYVLRRPDLLVATPIDPLFVLLPMIVNSSDYTNSYLSCSDYMFNTDLEGYEALQQLLRQPAFAEYTRSIEHRLQTVCDSITLGDDEDAMYRLSVTKLTQVLVSKAIRVAENGLPASLEQRFVQQALDIPEAQPDQVDPQAIAGCQNNTSASMESLESQESMSSESTANTTSTTATSISSSFEQTISGREIAQLLRVRTAWDYMIRAYVDKSLHSELSAAFSQQTVVDMHPLVEHEKRTNTIRQKAQALRTLSDNISRKRTLDDDEAVAKADEKRRKKEEEEQRKKSVSHGVKKLMKADTSGMKKLSSFFTKPTAK